MEEECRLPVACALSPESFRRRADEVRAGIARRVTATRELDNGIALRLVMSTEALADAEAFVTNERQCCGFATFELRREEEEAALWVEIRGPEGTQDFFETIFAAEASGEPAC